MIEMKAQIATLEIAISVFFIAAISSAVMHMENSETSNIYLSKSVLRSSMALFDLSNQLEYNSTAARCALSAYFNSSKCLQSYISAYEHAYSLNGIEIIISGKSFGSVKNATTHICIISQQYGYPICIFIGG
ncbi:MAG: hypothetical protein QXU79_01390 [Candidatus Micrarchaeaceae archaeon]